MNYRHLKINAIEDKAKLACGAAVHVHQPVMYTNDPRVVTCDICKKTKKFIEMGGEGRHLDVSREDSTPACGVRRAQDYTIDPSLVTCKSCKATAAYAEELADRSNKQLCRDCTGFDGERVMRNCSTCKGTGWIRQVRT